MAYLDTIIRKGTEYEIRDTDAQNKITQITDNMIAVSDTQPSGDSNKVWIKETADEVDVPTMAEHNALAADVEQNTEDISDLDTRLDGYENIFTGNVDTSVQNWLGAHPEATTTVQDGSITAAKLASGVIDPTLSISGAAAEAKATGDAVNGLRSALDELIYTKTITRTGVGRINEPFPLTAGQTIRVTNKTTNALAMAFIDANNTRSGDTSVSANTSKDFTLDYDVIAIAPYYNSAGTAIFENLAKRVPVLETKVGNILINNEPDLSTYTWEIGAFNATGGESASTTRIRSDFIPVSAGTKLSVSGETLCLNGVFYDKDKNFLSNMSGWSTTYTVPTGAGFFRFLVRKAQNNPTLSDADISPLVARCSLVLSLPESVYQYDDYKVEVAEKLDTVDAKISELVYKKAITRTAVGRITEPFPLNIGDTIKVTNNTATALAMAFVDNNNTRTSDYSVHANSERYFVIGVDVETESSFVAIAPYFNNTGTAIFENYSKRVPKLEMGFFTSSAYNTGLNLESKLEDYAELFVNDSAEVDSYLFFTDPHIFQHLVDEDKMQLAVGTIEHTFNNSSANFVLDGGDWLQENDTQNEACYKLGRINGIMRHKFGDKYFRLLGNHDNNEQGVVDSENASSGLLSQSTINALLFSEYGKAYYTFKTVHTRYYAFDSGSDHVTSMTDYKWEQVSWLADKLIENDDKHSVLAIHIYEYGGQENPTVSVFADNLTKIAQAYNARTSITLNDSTYNFASATGKVAYMIAGHTHYDKTTTQNSIPVFITLNATYTPSFDLIYVDYDNQLLSSVRVGSGTDRTMAIIS